MAHHSFARIAALAAALILPGAAIAQDRSETVRFAPGSTSTTVDARIRGYEGVRYSVAAAQGQRLSVEFDPDNASCYFNLLPPGSQTADFIGSSEGNRYAGVLATSGEQIIQVYLMRNAARRDEICNYALLIEIE